MKYPEKTFTSNFAGAYKSQDDEITRDLLYHELGWLIANDKKDVLAMLKEIGVTVNAKASDADIINAIVSNSSNRRLHIGVAYLIADKNNDSKTKQGEDDNSTESQDQVSDITSAVGTIFNGTPKSMAISYLTKSTTANKNGGSSSFTGSTGKKIYLGYWILAGVILVGVGTYFYMKHKGITNVRDLFKKADGGLISEVKPPSHQQHPQ